MKPFTPALLRRLSFAALVVAVAGCDPLNAFDPRETCGNGVVEPASGEFCDTFPLTPVDMMLSDYHECGKPSTSAACRFICDPAGKNPKCPTTGGFGCGLDGIRRAPTALFERPAALPIGAGEVHVGDVNGDSHPDFLVVEEQGLGVYLGGLLGGYARVAGTPGNPGRVSLALGQFSFGGVADVALLVNNAFVRTIGSSTGDLLPVAFPWQTLDAVAGQYQILPMRAVAPYDHELLLGISFDMKTRLVTAKVFGVDDASLDAGALQQFAATMMGFVASPVAGDIDRVGGNGKATPDEFVIASQASPAASVFSLECNTDKGPCTIVPRGTIALPRRGVSSAFFADVDGDGLLDVVFRLAQPDMAMMMGAPMTAIAYRDGDGFSRRPKSSAHDGAGLLNLASLACPACSFGSAAVLAVADLDGDQTPDLVAENGIQFVRSLADGTVVAGPTPDGDLWKEAVARDFNRDGDGDMALLSAGRGGVDLLVGTGGINLNHLFVNASSSVIHGLEAGDYDGDHFTDLGFITDARSVNVLFSDARGLPRTKALQASGSRMVENLITVHRGEGLPEDLVLTARVVAGARQTMDKRDIATLRGDGGQLLRTSVGLGTIPRGATNLDDPPVDGITLGRFVAGGAGLDTLLLVRDANPRSLRLLPSAAASGDTVPVPLKVGTKGCDPIVGAILPTIVAADLVGAGSDAFRDELVVVVPLPVKGPMMGVTTIGVMWASVTQDAQGNYQLACAALESLTGPWLASGSQVVDVDGDGSADLLVTLNTAPEAKVGMNATSVDGFAVYYGQADAQNPFEQKPKFYSTPADLRAVTVIGGHIAMFGSSWSALVSLKYPNRELPASKAWPPLSSSTALSVTALHVADIDGNGLDDLVLTGDATSVMFQKECKAQLYEADTGTCTEGP